MTVDECEMRWKCFSVFRSLTPWINFLHPMPRSVCCSKLCYVGCCDSSYLANQPIQPTNQGPPGNHQRRFSIGVPRKERAPRTPATRIPASRSGGRESQPTNQAQQTGGSASFSPTLGSEPPTRTVHSFIVNRPLSVVDPANSGRRPRGSEPQAVHREPTRVGDRLGPGVRNPPPRRFIVNRCVSPVGSAQGFGTPRPDGSS
jgi:hypothetical protein